MITYSGARVAQWVRSLDLTTHTSLSPIWRGFAPDFVNYKKVYTRLAAASDKVYQLLAQGRWFSPGTPAFSTTKTGRHDIAEILLKVALNSKNQNQSYSVELVQGSVTGRFVLLQCTCTGIQILFSSCKYLSLPCKSHSCYVDPWPFLLWWTHMSTPLHSHQDVKSGIILRTVMTSVPFSLIDIKSWIVSLNTWAWDFNK